MKEGDFVVFNNKNSFDFLSYGKYYKIITSLKFSNSVEYAKMIKIIDDDNKSVWIENSHFMTQSEYRNQQLNKLIENESK